MVDWEDERHSIYMEGYNDGYEKAMSIARRDLTSDFGRRGNVRKSTPSTSSKKKRKPSAYNKRYGRAFKRLAPKYKKKNGQWKKDGFKRAAAAARREAKR